MIESRRRLAPPALHMQIEREWAIPPQTGYLLRAIRVAPGAIEALRAGSTWKILSSHRHAVNFVDSAGKLLSLIEGQIHMGPFSIQVDAIPARAWYADQPDPLRIALEGETRVSMGGRILDLSSAVSWNPRPDWSALVTVPWRFEFLPVLLNRLRTSAPPESLACVLDLLSTHSAGPDAHRSRLRDMPRAAAATACLRLCQTLAEGKLNDVAAASAALAGMGPGLTPSGDDFLIGVMFGIQSALPTAKAKARSNFIYRASAGRTNTISNAWLSAASDGQAIQAWHELVDSILSFNSGMVDRACQNLIELGHTSGADALAGFASFHLGHNTPPAA
ncbi:MAG TPA: DUF2877 domain-containing protein [Anaerolineales bacterium]|nr:DUF2877 domain-containing protein [Anaerolineales bacterium]